MVRRETVEELGVPAVFDQSCGQRPFLLTVTRTGGPVEGQHTDVSLWFALSGWVGQPLVPDPREFVGVSWWPADLTHVDPRRFEPHLPRAVTALGLASSEGQSQTHLKRSGPREKPPPRFAASDSDATS